MIVDVAYEYLKELNEDQHRAVVHTGSPLLILAGAGSGKTKTLTYRAAYAVQSKIVAADQVLLLTFTNKAAKEMQERVSRITSEHIHNVSTFHSLAARVLRRQAKNVGLDSSFVIYDGQDQADLVKEVMGELNIDPKRFKPSGILAGISGAKQEMVSPGQYSDLARGDFQEMVADVFRRYQNKLLKYTAVDFDDLLLYLAKILESESLRSYYQNQFEHIYVDEYQDTNTVQYKITKLLNGERANLVVVGDASQSIYGWRGADYRNITRLKSDYKDLTEIRLERNYRSTQNILSAASSVINHNTNHPVLALWTEVGDGDKVGVIEAYSASDESSQVVEKLRRLVEQGYKYSEIAILYRTNAQSRAFEEALIRNGIPYVLVGGVKFYERKEVKDIISYMRLAINPEDKVSFARAEKNGKRKLASFLASLEGKITKEMKPAELMDLILSSTQYLSKLDEEVSEDLARIENIRELQNVASEFSSPSDFLENVSLVQAEYFVGEIHSASSGQEHKDRITLMTLHGAKGLEFRAVFLVGLEEGILPHARALTDEEQMQEERRLMYVGITRAKEKLFVSYAKMRNLYGSSNPSQKSRFLDEIEPELMALVSSNTGNGISSLNNWGSNRVGFGEKLVTKKTGIRVDSLGDSTLDAFLSGEISVEELLNR
jgi:DNA helicase II / ATP-dependent DNA helicase PcrA